MMTYATDEWRDESDVGLCASNGLSEAKEEGEVAVDAVVLLEHAGSLDTLPGGCNLDENTLFLNADALVELDVLESLCDRALGVE